MAKSVTEFWSATLLKGLKAKEALTTEGKSPEEIQTAIGEQFKYEGDKLKYFMGAMEVASANLDKLSIVKVVSVGEGETAPPKSTKIEEHHYIPEFQTAARAPVTTKADTQRGGGKGGKGGGKDGRPKTSPWGLTPEEKAAKKGGGKASTPKA